MTTENKETERINNARRMLTLMRILKDMIKEKDLTGIAIWSNEAFDCMLHIEKDNGL